MQDNYEEFSESQLKILDHFVTNTSSHIFALRNLPEVIKGALFSRYSRSTLGLRSLLLKEFITNNEEAEFAAIVGASGSEKQDPSRQAMAIKKAQNFYDRILDGYGDDSIGELGGAHLALENISIIAAKVLEDCRIGGSPLEKSTRYIYFDQKVNGEYLFYREPILMTSAYRSIYLDTCNMLFDTYSQLIPPMTEWMEKRFPRDPETSKVAYTASLRAKVLDCLRGLLPASTLTNMGVYGNGRFFEVMIKKLHCHNLAELQDIGKRCYDELEKVMPSFIRRADTEHRHFETYANFAEATANDLHVLTKQHGSIAEKSTKPGVKLVDFDKDATSKVAAALLFTYGDRGMEELEEYCKGLSGEELARILDGACNQRENRRHKSPRALELADYTFEIIADFGSYRDLQRHRLASQERQLLSCDYGFYIPPEIVGTEMESKYLEAMHKAKEVYDTIAEELPEEAQYVVPMAYNIRWYMRMNMRELQWLCELRSSAAGHPSYRAIAQEMANQVSQATPEFERFLRFVDYEGYELGRLQQEERKVEKLKNR